MEMAIIGCVSELKVYFWKRFGVCVFPGSVPDVNWFLADLDSTTAGVGRQSELRFVLFTSYNKNSVTD